MPDVTKLARSTLIALLLGLASQVAAAFSYELSEPELQEKFSSAMPLEIKKQHYTLIIFDPVLSLGSADGDIIVQAHINFSMASGQAAGTITFKGRLAYEVDTSSFFIRNVVIKQIRAEGIPEIYQPGLKLVAQLAASRTFSRHPVYVIKDDSVKARFAKSFLKSVTVTDHKLILSMEVF